jgi:hypothetical protein
LTRVFSHVNKILVKEPLNKNRDDCLASLKTMSNNNEESNKQDGSVSSNDQNQGILPIRSARITYKISRQSETTATKDDVHEIQVELQIPNTPTVCDSCEHSDFLLVSKRTGELECNLTGCDHGHGFRTIILSVPPAFLESHIVYMENKKKIYSAGKSESLE